MVGANVNNEKCDMQKILQKNSRSHLQILVDEFNRYFPEYKQTEGYPKLLRNPFGIVREVAEKIQKGLIELQNDRNCKDTFECVSLEEF